MKKIVIFIILFSIPAIVSAQWVRDMRPVVKAPPASSSTPAPSVSVSTPSLSPMLPATDIYYIWPASDCQLRYQDFPPADGNDSVSQTGRVDRFPYLRVNGSSYASERSYEVFEKGVSFICPVRLPEGSSVSRILLQGAHSGMLTLDETWATLEFVEKSDRRHELIASASQKISPEGAMPTVKYFNIDMSVSDTQSARPIIPYYVLIRIYGRTVGGVETALSYNSFVDLKLITVEYKYWRAAE